MTIKALSPNVSVSPQIAIEDVAAAANQGFRSIISNRPDGEEPGLPGWAEFEAAAREAGLEARHIPVVAQAISESDVATFEQALEQLPKPILAFCRTGTRSTILWALANDGALTADERIRTAARAGYDLEPFRARMGDSADRP
jgi:sulfide:quinone oxidoreductase